MVLVGGVVLGAILLRVVAVGHVDQTSVLFIGIPTVLALVVAGTEPARTATGAAMKAVTLALLVAWVFLGEGVICVVIAAPVLYLPAVVVGRLIDFSRRRRRNRGGGGPLPSLAVVPLLLMSLEGVGGLNLPREQSVSAHRVVNASATAVEARLARPPDITKPLPWLLAMGFPRPVSASGGGLHTGDVRTIVFEGSRPGVVTVVVQRSEPGDVVLQVVRNDSLMAHWVTWEDIEFSWNAVAPARTAVTCTVHFRRDLSPAFYFAPVEGFGDQQMADWLIGAAATP